MPFDCSPSVEGEGDLGAVTVLVVRDEADGVASQSYMPFDCSLPVKGRVRVGMGFERPLVMPSPPFNFSLPFKGRARVGMGLERALVIMLMPRSPPDVQYAPTPTPPTQ